MLSAEQMQIANAVMTRSGNNLAVALPGSGKSTTCIAAIVDLLKADRKARPWMVTFTKAAAVSISSKLKLLLSKKDFDRVGVSTFHAIIGEQYRQLPNAKKLLLGPKQNITITNSMMDDGFIGDFQEARQTIDRETRNLVLSSLSSITRAYMSRCERQNDTDYNIACREVVLGLRADKVRRLNVTHMIVDEFQDTDEVQLAWLWEHAAHGIKVTAVGDDDQSIYSFRGGLGFKIMSMYTEQFAAQTYYLSTCYRCGTMILKAAGRTISANTGRIAKAMNAAAKHTGQISIVTAPDSEISFQAVSNSIMKHEGSWAVLSRNGLYLDVMELKLREENITCKRIGGQSIWDQSAADSMLRLFKMALHGRTDQNSHYALSYMFQMDHDEVDAFTDIGRLSLAEATLNLQPGLIKNALLMVLAAHGDTDDLAKMNKYCRDIKDTLKKLPFEKGDFKTCETVIGFVLAATGSWHTRLHYFVDKLDAIKQKTELTLEPTVVTLATLHGAKGLEWDNVAIIGCNDGVLPSNKSDTPETIEEERRLMYVGMTRAIHRLELHSHAKPCIYLNELVLDQALTITQIALKPGDV